MKSRFLVAQVFTLFPISLSLAAGPDQTVFEFIAYDRTAIEKLVATSIIQRNSRDYEYFFGLIHQIDAEFKHFLEDTINGPRGLNTLSSTSMVGHFVQAKDFVGMVREYQTKKELLVTKISSLSLLSQGNLPSQVGELPTPSAPDRTLSENSKFEPLVEYYLEKVDCIDSQVRDLGYRIQLPDGHLHVIQAQSGQGLSLPRGLAKISVSQLRSLKAQARQLQAWERPEREVIDRYTKFLRESVQRFIYTYGQSEKYRIQDEKTQQALKNEAQALTEAFWTRSYLRAQYGMPLGAIGFRYKKSWAHLDRFKVSNAALSELLENPVWRESEYIEISNGYLNALKVLGERNSSILSGNVSILSALNGVLTTLSGERSYSQVLEMVLKLLAADLYEERLIIQAGGKAKMISYYKSRYMTTPTEIAYYRQLKAQYEPDASEIVSENFYADVNVSGSQGSSLRSHFNAVVDACKLQEYRLHRALDLNQQIAVFEGVTDSVHAKRRQKSDL